ncbi:hypothetical protein AC578_10141 [Pseudocercospora eumusae]|uniref:Restriction of telomere capping protein 4 n=1 Tax=Pseudocercospora eumusae TaxID=321146 RepID=A0A139HYU9_9PEZI|nr:hypothetical protein AC578_10141 [Pseudocercospora eumusae]
MPALSRHRYRPLLSVVNGHAHASSDDHEDGIAIQREDHKASNHIPAVPPSKRRMRFDRKTATPERPKKRVQEEVIELDASPVKQKGGKTAAEKPYPSPEHTESTRSSQNEVIMLDEEEDYNASPKASSSDIEEEKSVKAAPSEVKGTSGFQMKNVSLAKHVVQQREEPKRTFVDPRMNGALLGKRKVMNDTELDDDSDDEPSWMSEKRKKLKNMHTRSKQTNTKPKPNIFISKPSSQHSRYGKEAAMKQKIAQKQFQKSEAAALKQKAKSPPTKKFKTVEAFGYGSTASSQANSAVQMSQTSAGAELEGPEIDDSPLTEISEDEIDETETLEGVATAKCGHCGEALKRSLLEDFQDEFLRGRELTYKWQRRFCRWHQQQKAEAQWRERGYPEIDWKQLSLRMRAHDSILKDIVNDKVGSYYRDELRSKSKKSRKDIEDVITGNDSRGGASMGYYGPKGEKLMHVTSILTLTEHIIGRFTNDIRQRSKKDKLVSTSGVQGGVSGFVQVVLAPHLVELLVKEDMNLGGNDWEIRAREIIAESTQLGELLHPEEEDDKVDDIDTARVMALVDDDDDG